MKQLRARYQGPLSDVERAFLDAIVHHEEAARHRTCLLLIGRSVLVLAAIVGALTLAIVFRHQTAREQQLNAELTNASQGIARQLDETQKRERELAAANLRNSEQTAELEAKTAELKAALAQSQLNKEQAEKNAAESRRARAEAERARDDAVKQRAEAERLRDAAEARWRRASPLLGPGSTPPPASAKRQSP